MLMYLVADTTARPRMIKKVNHIGIAVKNLATAVGFYAERLHLSVEKVEEVKDQEVKVALIPIDNVRVELLQSTDPQGPIARFIEKRGEGIHHIAFEVDAIEDTLQELKENGIQLIDDKPRMGAHITKIAFLNPRSTNGVLYELCETRSSGGC